MASTTRATNARIKQIAAEIRKLEAVVTESRSANSYGPAVAALKAIGLLNADVSRLKSQAAIEAEPDPVKRVGMQRQLALAANSHVAAAKLAQVEAGLVLGLAQAGAQRAEAELTNLSADDLVGIILASIATMPPADVELIANACDRRASEVREDDE